MIFNHCEECNARIPWRKRAFFGNTYKPVICSSCHEEDMVSLYGSLANYDLAMIRAAQIETKYWKEKH